MEIKLKSDISITSLHHSKMSSQYFKLLFPIRDKINNLYIKGWKERFDKTFESTTFVNIK